MEDGEDEMSAKEEDGEVCEKEATIQSKVGDETTVEGNVGENSPVQAKEKAKLSTGKDSSDETKKR